MKPASGNSPSAPAKSEAGRSATPAVRAIAIQIRTGANSGKLRRSASSGTLDLAAPSIATRSSPVR
jgi:hypothetical protein